ncbi:MAG: FAD-binding oxidoreductase, partial [Rhodospirillaceae bacterium]|nr:FAD-binding oxidoreductase [Rhodospirillaceae bacterium]
ETENNRRDIEKIVFNLLSGRGGSISAEHGIGLVKRDFIELSRSPEELALMRRLKVALDPENILNPGKIFQVS